MVESKKKTHKLRIKDDLNKLSTKSPTVFSLGKHLQLHIF